MSDNALLAPAQHDMVLTQASAIFEDEALLQPNVNLRQAARPDLGMWVRYRMVIMHWDPRIRSCAQADLSAADFNLMEKAILESDALHIHSMEVARGFPKQIPLAMIPDSKASMKHERRNQRGREVIGGC